LGDRTHFTGEEKDEFEQGSTARGVAFVRSVGNFVGDEPWADRGQLLTEGERAALIVDPANGKLPDRTDYGKQSATGFFQQMSDDNPSDPEVRTVLERCIVAPLVPIRPMNFNNNFKIIQTSDHVIILMEMVHDARIVPIERGDQPKARSGVARWLGESIGRWEDETLVVETRNFRAYQNLLGTSPGLHLIERFTVRGESQLIYEFTVADPEVFTETWSARQTMNRLDGRIYEYACHEGNVSMQLMLRGARRVETERASGASP
jgi:hypothetical protein